MNLDDVDDEILEDVQTMILQFLKSNGIETSPMLAKRVRKLANSIIDTVAEFLEEEEENWYDE